MTITITINCDNGAFDGDDLDHEVYRILADLTERVSEFGVRKSYGNISDINGNTVGRMEVK